MHANTIGALVPLLGLLAGAASAQQPLGRVPDPCALLTRADAAELMGEPVEPGRSYPTSPWNCVYRARGSDGLLTLTLELGRGTEVESTRSGIELAGCGAEVEAELEGPGETALLYHTPDGRCGEAWTLWAATGIRFRGRTSARAARVSEGVFHITVVRYPPAGRDSAEPVLRDAARRVIVRLREPNEERRMRR